jgi:hypothetical protein
MKLFFAKSTLSSWQTKGSLAMWPSDIKIMCIIVPAPYLTNFWYNFVLWHNKAQWMLKHDHCQSCFIFWRSGLQILVCPDSGICGFPPCLHANTGIAIYLKKDQHRFLLTSLHNHPSIPCCIPNADERPSLHKPWLDLKEPLRSNRWRKLHNEGLHNMYSLPNKGLIRVIKIRRVRWAGYVAPEGKITWKT